MLCPPPSLLACNPFRHPIATNEAVDFPHGNTSTNIRRHYAPDQSGDSQILSSFLWSQQRKYPGWPAGTGEVKVTGLGQFLLKIFHNPPKLILIKVDPLAGFVSLKSQ